MTTYPQVKMLIAGEWIESGGEGAMSVVNPATEQKIGSAPKVSKEQLDAALAAADEAFAFWSETPAIEPNPMAFSHPTSTKKLLPTGGVFGTKSFRSHNFFWSCAIFF